MSDISRIIAVNVRKERVKQGLTQESLAEKADLHPNYIGMIERQQRNISVVALEEIAKALKVPLTDLLRK
jgi:transcriptional regulator with XRE-family HTH domain